jgi:hypothetical protein
MLKALNEMLDILIAEDLAQTQVTDRNYGGKMNFNNDWRSKRQRGSAPTDEHEKMNKQGELGRGIFSKVVSNPEDPHTVKKISTSPMGPGHAVKADGFNAYVRMLASNDLMDNVHFPKVYKANTSTDTSGTHRNSFTIERLTDLSSISEEEFQALVERCLLRPVYDVAGLADRISGACQSDYDRKTFIKMESLLEACEIIDELDGISDFRLDIHEGNLMVRRTPHGLQLVISDPFGMVKSQWKHKYS